MDDEIEADDEDEDENYGSPPRPTIPGSGGANSFVGHDTQRIDAIPTPPPFQRADSGLPVVQETYRVFQMTDVINDNPNFPSDENDSPANNVAQSARLPDGISRGFKKTQCQGCNLNTIRFSQKSCGHVVCGACLARYEGMPCKICKQPVGGIQQIDASVFL